MKHFSEDLEFHLHYMIHVDGTRNMVGGWCVRKKLEKILTTTKREILLLALLKVLIVTAPIFFTYTM